MTMRSVKITKKYDLWKTQKGDCELFIKWQWFSLPSSLPSEITI